MSKDFTDELSKLPDKPGVYLMHDKHDTIIYVGKAVSLRNRVRQYFRASHNEGIRKEKMVQNIERFEYIITDSELEALVLECNLIKKHKPRYNTLLRDDKTYPFIKVTIDEEYPRILFTREIKNDKAKYFGPFTAQGSVKDTINYLNKIYKLRTCNGKEAKSERPCLNYHINQCFGPCHNEVSRADYMENVNEALEFLKGNHTKTFSMLQEKMLKASEELDFEKAAEYRDLLESIKNCVERQKITSAEHEDVDVIALARDEKEAVVCILFIRNGKLLGRDHFFLGNVEEDGDGEILSTFIQQFYNGALFIPKEIYIEDEIENKVLLEEYLNDVNKNTIISEEDITQEHVSSNAKMRRINIVSPKIGKKKKLVEMAKSNAKLILENDKERMRREEGRTIGALKQIAELLDFEKIDRMEAYDISNISGYDAVGSMVVFEKGKPKYNDYRKFRLKTVDGPNDYASMEEVLTRRFTRGIEELREGVESSFSHFPDVIMMDGGKGQIGIALKVLQQLKLNIPVCGMVKDDHHNTRGLIYEGKEIAIDADSEGFKLITRLQDEAHRFAITYHKNLRNKGMVHSALDDIAGIGPKRRKALMKHFVDIEAIREATIDELKDVDSMDMNAAKAVYDYFHK